MSDQTKLVVVGSVAIDWIITPKAEREVSIGGSATYFSMAASQHAAVGVVGVIGSDFPKEGIADLERAGVNLEGLEVVADGLTFRWKGRYHENMNDRDTLETHLNCFEAFSPKVPVSYARAPHLFLANIQPGLQAAVLDQMEQRPSFVGLDTMNLWIDICKDELEAVISRVDLLVINEEEAKQISGKDSLAAAARDIRGLGARHLIIKRGEFGALFFGESGSRFSVPGLLLDEVIDPTGAGDCFAGGMMGYLSSLDEISEDAIRRAMVHGSVTASFCCEGFSYDRLRGLDRAELDQRFAGFVELTRF